MHASKRSIIGYVLLEQLQMKGDVCGSKKVQNLNGMKSKYYYVMHYPFKCSYKVNMT